MSQIQPIGVNTRTFSPVRRDGVVVFYRDLSETIPSLRPTLSISLAEPTKTSKLYKARVRVTIPRPELNTEGDPTGRVQGLNSFDINAIYDAASTANDRAELISTLKALVTSEEFGEVVQDLLPLY